MAAVELPQAQPAAVVLVVDDAAAVRDGVSGRMQAEGFEAVTAADGLAALEALRTVSPDLIVLDLELPGLSGFEVLRRIAAQNGPPVILLSGLGSEADRALGLEMGAADCVTKPFSSRELAVRARRLLERTQHTPGNLAPVADLFEGTLAGIALTVDFTSRRVNLGDAEISLRPREFDLLAFFVRNPRQVLSKPQLLQAVWAAETGWVGEATVTEHVRRLRSKLKVEGSDLSPIDTLWGVGYRFEPET
jgi:two-component system alkaline phosphatase synthesis response regulator PhoP